MALKGTDQSSADIRLKRINIGTLYILIIKCRVGDAQESEPIVILILRLWKCLGDAFGGKLGTTNTFQFEIDRSAVKT